MARLNIEQEYWSDIRRGNLAIKLGCVFKADGVLINAWKLAQAYWCPHQKLIPYDKWKSAGLPDAMFECGMAELRGNEVYIKGTEQNFAWYFEKIESGRTGGRVSAQRPRDEKGRLLSKQTQAPLGCESEENVQAVLGDDPSTSKRIQPSSSSSSQNKKKSPLPPSCGSSQKEDEDIDPTILEANKKLLTLRAAMSGPEWGRP